ncbi:hypothetical protein [Rubrobacter calidifluminis]|uniref:hypothetical protein n=1 Tax=Rubrobacter calidifluminis TaxID=1392640 RepID=UPI00235E2EEF|nr:hypothetical protein [Rubrobacter calidifluminis]
MNFFNRLVLIIFALIIIIIPVLLLLIGYGVIPQSQISSYFDYQAAVNALGKLSISSIQSAKSAYGVGGIVAAVIFFVLFLAEILPRIKRPDDVIIEDTPGKEVRIQPRALRALAEGAALEAGALSANITLRSGDEVNRVRCVIEAPSGTNLSNLAQKVKEKIRQEYQKQRVRADEVEVIVKRTLEPSEKRSVR